jgi:hypothetical protein
MATSISVMDPKVCMLQTLLTETFVINLLSSDVYLAMANGDGTCKRPITFPDVLATSGRGQISKGFLKNNFNLTSMQRHDLL